MLDDGEIIPGCHLEKGKRLKIPDPHSQRWIALGIAEQRRGLLLPGETNEHVYCWHPRLTAGIDGSNGGNHPFTCNSQTRRWWVSIQFLMALMLPGEVTVMTWKVLC